jgi:hypothetical protein
MTTTQTPAKIEATTKPLSLEVEWADWDENLPRTESSAVLTKALKKEIKELVAEGVYPAGTRFVRHIRGGLEGERREATIELSFPDTKAAFEFYTAYCGGDQGQAIEELVEFHDIDPADLPARP